MVIWKTTIKSSITIEMESCRQENVATPSNINTKRGHGTFSFMTLFFRYLVMKLSKTFHTTWILACSLPIAYVKFPALEKIIALGFALCNNLFLGRQFSIHNGQKLMMFMISQHLYSTTFRVHVQLCCSGC